MAWVTGTEFTITATGDSGEYGTVSGVITSAGESNIQVIQVYASDTALLNLKVEGSIDGTTFFESEILVLSLMTSLGYAIGTISQAYPFYRFSCNSADATDVSATCILGEMTNTFKGGWATTEFTMVGGDNEYGTAVEISGAGTSNIALLQVTWAADTGNFLKIQGSVDGTNYSTVTNLGQKEPNTSGLTSLITEFPQAYPYYRFSAKDDSGSTLTYTCVLAEMV